MSSTIVQSKLPATNIDIDAEDFKTVDDLRTKNLRTSSKCPGFGAPLIICVFLFGVICGVVLKSEVTKLITDNQSSSKSSFNNPDESALQLKSRRFANLDPKQKLAPINNDLVCRREILSKNYVPDQNNFVMNCNPSLKLSLLLKENKLNCISSNSNGAAVTLKCVLDEIQDYDGF